MVCPKLIFYKYPIKRFIVQIVVVPKRKTLKFPQRDFLVEWSLRSSNWIPWILISSRPKLENPQTFLPYVQFIIAICVDNTVAECMSHPGAGHMLAVRQH